MKPYQYSDSEMIIMYNITYILSILNFITYEEEVDIFSKYHQRHGLYSYSIIGND